MRYIAKNHIKKTILNLLKIVFVISLLVANISACAFDNEEVGVVGGFVVVWGVDNAVVDGGFVVAVEGVVDGGFVVSIVDLDVEGVVDGGFVVIVEILLGIIEKNLLYYITLFFYDRINSMQNRLLFDLYSQLYLY